MDQPTFSAGWSGGGGGGWVGAAVELEGKGEVGFDVSPGWRRALITGGWRKWGERMVWVQQRSADELRVARARLQQHFHLFREDVERRLRML